MPANPEIPDAGFFYVPATVKRRPNDTDLSDIMTLKLRSVKKKG